MDLDMYFLYFRTQIIDQNLPDVLKIYMEAQAVEIARRCVQPPLKKNPK